MILYRLRLLILVSLICNIGITYAQSKTSVLPPCIGHVISQWDACRGILDESTYSYAGDFANGKFEGRGILEFTGSQYEGDYYEGEFKNGLKHGFGVYKFSNGDKYVGQYQSGQRHGQGTYSFADGKPAVSGLWSRNKLQEKDLSAINANSSNSRVTEIDLEKKKIETLKAEINQSIAEYPSTAINNNTNLVQKDAVAIVIGIQNYERLPVANYANHDAVQFKEYLQRYLGVNSANVKLLLNSQAQRAEILLAFKYWLPAHINTGKTDVYIYFSGHGLQQEPVKQQYLLPYDVNTDLLNETGINQKSIIQELSSLGAKSVTVFLDSCYSGSSRKGEPLIQNQRAVSIKVNPDVLPPGINVFSASSKGQTANSDDSLKHGVFSYFLLKGLSEEAAMNGNKNISLGDFVDYVTQKTSKYALGMHRQQEPEFIGDRQQVLVFR